jgi:hypothetical protein
MDGWIDDARSSYIARRWTRDDEERETRNRSDVRCREDETRGGDAREMTRGFSMDGWIKRDDEDDRDERNEMNESYVRLTGGDRGVRV